MVLVLAAATPCLAILPIKVVSSFSILGDMVKSIGGERVQVTLLVGPDADAHVYEPTPADAKAIHEADLLMINGLGFEGWLKRLIEAAQYHGTVAVATDGIFPLQLQVAGGKEIRDPHAWQSLENARIYVRNVASALAKADPAGLPEYEASLRRYEEQIAQADLWVRSEIGKVPVPRRKVITSHDAFGYFARDYGVAFYAPQGWSTEDQPAAAKVAFLIRQIRSSGITALFVENITDPRLMDQLARETGGRIGGKLYSDALSRAGGPADTYLKLFRYNVRLLTSGMLALPPASTH